MAMDLMRLFGGLGNPQEMDPRVGLLMGLAQGLGRAGSNQPARGAPVSMAEGLSMGLGAGLQNMAALQGMRRDALVEDRFRKEGEAADARASAWAAKYGGYDPKTRMTWEGPRSPDQGEPLPPMTRGLIAGPHGMVSQARDFVGPQIQEGQYKPPQPLSEEDQLIGMLGPEVGPQAMLQQRMMDKRAAQALAQQMAQFGFTAQENEADRAIRREDLGLRREESAADRALRRQGLGLQAQGLQQRASEHEQDLAVRREGISAQRDIANMRAIQEGGKVDEAGELSNVLQYADAADRAKALLFEGGKIDRSAINSAWLAAQGRAGGLLNEGARFAAGKIDPKGQQLLDMADSMAQTQTFLLSGKSATDAERQAFRNQVLPRPGDDDATIQQKMARFDNFWQDILTTLQAQGPRGAQKAALVQQMLQQKRGAQPQAGAPAAPAPNDPWGLLD